MTLNCPPIDRLVPNFPIPFIQAKNYTPAERGIESLDRIVLHAMEGGDTIRKARNTAMWFAGRTKDPAPMASAHFCVDDQEIIQCVRETDVAYHARGSNHNSIGIEMAGTSKQSSEQWKDEYSAAVLDKAMTLTAMLCWKWHIPPRILGVEDLLDGHAGITTHAAVSMAFKKSTHTDPGNGFDLVGFVTEAGRRLEQLREYIQGLVNKGLPKEEKP